MQLKVIRFSSQSKRQGCCTGSLSSLPEIQWKILWERQMLMTAEFTEDRFLGVVTKTKNLPSSYFIIMSSIPPVPEAIVVTITGWKR